MIGEFSNETMNIDYKESLKITIECICAVFKFPVFDMDSLIDELSDIVESEDLQIMFGIDFMRFQ